MREAFEKWFIESSGFGDHGDLFQVEGMYVQKHAYQAWLTWSAAWESSRNDNH